MAVLSLLPKFKSQFHESLEAFGACFAEKKGLLTSTLGPFMLGSGMTLSGAVSTVIQGLNPRLMSHLASA